jgi:hypothetical protein
VAIQCGDTFILGLGGHLWVVISEPAKHAGHFVIVNLTTDVFRAGTECELIPGDHQWITKKCYVSFGDAREVTPKQELQIMAHMASRAITKQYPMSGPILQKIIVAAKKSKALPTGFLIYFDTAT